MSLDETKEKQNKTKKRRRGKKIYKNRSSGPLELFLDGYRRNNMLPSHQRQPYTHQNNNRYTDTHTHVMSFVLYKSRTADCVCDMYSRSPLF